MRQLGQRFFAPTKKFGSSDIYSNYILEPYIYSDAKETITITQSNSSEILPLKCSIKINNNKKNDSGGLSTGGIIAIVCSIVGALIIAGIVFLIIRKKTPNRPISMTASSYLQSTADNIDNKY